MKKIFNPSTGAARAVREDGVVLAKGLFGGWREIGRLKAGITPESYLAKRLRAGWRAYREGDVPSLKGLEKWMANGMAKATDGCVVEPDGTCPHGCHSWLIVYGMM